MPDSITRLNVALKVLKAELAAVVGAERFLAEIETTAKLTHPHILRSMTRARRTASCSSSPRTSKARASGIALIERSSFLSKNP